MKLKSIKLLEVPELISAFKLTSDNSVDRMETEGALGTDSILPVDRYEGWGLAFPNQDAEQSFAGQVKAKCPYFPQ